MSFQLTSTDSFAFKPDRSNHKRFNGRVPLLSFIVLKAATVFMIPVTELRKTEPLWWMSLPFISKKLPSCRTLDGPQSTAGVLRSALSSYAGYHEPCKTRPPMCSNSL